MPMYRRKPADGQRRRQVNHLPYKTGSGDLTVMESQMGIDSRSSKRTRWRWTVIVAGAAICVTSSLFWWKHMKSQTDLVPYTPVVRRVDRGDHLFADAPELLTAAHVKAITSVLDRYGEHYEVHGTDLRIERKLSEDRDLLANYTEKAQGALAP
jgi:hypothetical protein